MFNILILADESRAISELRSGLTQIGFACSIASDQDDTIEQNPDLVLVELNDHSKMPEFALKIKEQKHLPILALIRQKMLANLDGQLNFTEDFVIEPYNLPEVEIRVKHLLSKTSNLDSNEVIKCGDLTIDVAKYEVCVSEKPINLTFKEYELLKFLISNQGRVFTREALLNKVWGYDYYGGDRTVDVHIKRLRSKIEGSSQAFIETVRNIGYRLRVTRQ